MRVPAEPGHIWVNTPALMKGYLARDDLTAQVVSNASFPTGDIGLIDDRERYLQWRERKEPLDLRGLLRDGGRPDEQDPRANRRTEG